MIRFFKLIPMLLLAWAIFPAVETAAAESKGTVLITGANRGIGLALAQNFSQIGYSVIGTARKPEKATELIETGARVQKLDVTDQASVDGLAKDLEGIEIDILINNAGTVGAGIRDTALLDVDDMMWQLDVNTLGPVRIMKALLSNVQSSKRKLVINISSMMGSIQMNSRGCCAGYRASKAALNSINQTFAVDYANKGMTFVVIHPGYVKTDMNEGRGNITSSESAAGLAAVISGLDTSDNGKFYDWQGEILPW